MIRFVFGRPGFGKTTYVIDHIRDEIARGITAGSPHRVWLLVPEQQAYSAERDILSALPGEAGRCFSIISFSRLADLVADRFGGRTQHTVTKAMRSLVMWENLRELTGLLETYAHGAGTDVSLCKKMLAATEELSINAIPPTKLESAADNLPDDSPLRAKLRDIALVSSAYSGLLTEIYGADPAERLLQTAAKLEKNPFFVGDSIYIDSYSSFTAEEYAVLRPIIEQAANVTVTLGCSGRYEQQPQFTSLTDAIRRLTRICEDCLADFEDVVLDGAHRDTSSELSILERQLWDFDLTPDRRVLPPEDKRGAIRLVTAPNLYDEAEAAAMHILELVQAGVPYGEIAVVVRDASEWRGVLDAALDARNIPFFLSERTDLSEKPAARLLLTALRCIARRWQAEDIVTLGKTGLCGITLREMDYFCEYIDTWRLTGRRMTDNAWSMNPDGYKTEMSPRALEILGAANHVREVIMTPLLALEQELRGAASVTDECRALYSYLRALGIRETLATQAEEMLSLGQVREAGEQVRLWSFLTETLATIASVMASAKPLTAEELGTALSLVFAETDIGSVPARHDCVTIGSASTLRVDNIRAMLILGLCEGEFPRPVREDSLLSEQDKAMLSTLGIELDSRAERLMADELLYLHRAMTKPSETLILSYATTTPDGQVRSPSSAFTRVKYLFPYMQSTTFSSRMLEQIEDSYRIPVADAVSRPTARRLLGEELWLSQSRLQTYARCPYSYYGSHILRLRERMDATFDNLGAGVFLHHVLEQYLRRALDEENQLRPMEEDEIRELADAVITAYITELCGNVSENGRLLHLLARLREVALVLIDNIQAELRQSDFTVAGLEWDTHGRRTGDPKPMTLSLEISDEDSSSVLEQITLSEPDFLEANFPTNRLVGTPDEAMAQGQRQDGFYQFPLRRPIQNMTPDGISGLPIFTPKEEMTPIRLLLGGRIDRVDIYRGQDGKTVYVRVIDYKSSKHEFTAKSFAEDMNIQLLLYLFTLCSPENRRLFATKDGTLPERVLPASAVYLSPDESGRDGEIRPLRTGVVRDEPEVLAAANRDSEAMYLPSVKRGRNQSLSGKGLCSPAQIEALEDTLRYLIRSTAAKMYAGCADRTPSDVACRYCIMQEACGVKCL